MKKNTYFLNKAKPVVGIIVFALTLLFISSNAYAAFDLRVRPYEGGYDLRYHNIDFEMGRQNKEIVVDITSDINKQYRLIQVLQEPLTNEQGTRIPENSFTIYALHGTNKYGTITTESDTPVFLGRSIIYTSNQQGLSDSFTLVYGLTLLDGQEPGSYRGRLQFTLEPIDSTQESRTVILNIFAEIEAKSRIEITTASGSKVLRLQTATPEKRSQDIVVNILGGLGRQFKIMQSLNQPLISSEGSELQPQYIKFMVRDATVGTGPTQPQPLSLQDSLIYTSGIRGQQDTFTVTYSLEDLAGQPAGNYSTYIKYFLEGADLQQTGLIDTLRLEVENPRIFDLEINPELGGRIEFKDLKPRQPPKAYEVLVEVKSNTSRRYQVSQKITSGLVNKQGYEIPSQYFTSRTEGVAGIKGATKQDQGQPVNKEKDITLFISDDEGSPASFKVIYELTPPPDVQAGDYSATLVYSLLEI
ncbi:MAG: hypothetical protein M0R66_03425 [Candidatus Omnitrophica bacterium]|nr:hypothetical protein [Candidatus Omnitrophota bacterium]